MAKKIGILINSSKSQAIDMGRDIYTWGGKNGINILVPYEDARALDEIGRAHV